MFLIITRLWYWQIAKSDELTAKAESQRFSKTALQAPRGEILFLDGSTLASSQPVFLVFAEPKVIKNKEEIGKLLAQILTKDLSLTSLNEEEIKEFRKKEEENILEKLSKDLFWVSLGKKVNLDTKREIEKLNIEGIGFEQSQARFYPEGSSSAHLLGFVGSDIYGVETGYFGIEGFYNGELKGKTGRYLEEKDAQGLPILIGLSQTLLAKPGKTLVLNIDRTIQHIVEESLKKGIEKYGAKGAQAVVMDPKTGNILAMNSLPSYDPGNLADSPKDAFKNPIIADTYEPGSTFKVLVMSAALNEDVVKPDTKCDLTCSGPLQIGGFTIRTWNNKYNPKSTVTDIIVHSDNTGMVFTANKLGKEKLFSYLQKFGFGDLTGVDLQDESSPQLRPLNEWKEIDLATASFGQGIAVSALQMVKAVGAIANEGLLMEPHVVKLIKEKQETFEVKPKIIEEIISKETAKKVTEMMVKAIEEGESKFAKPKGYKIAGKTGTAQIPVAGHYDPNKTIASFVGFAPADDPKFVMLVRYQEPSSSIFGSETAAPTFFEIAKELFIYLNIPPTEK